MAAGGSSCTERVGDFEVDLNDKHKLGTGATGNVFPARNVNTNTKVAEKKISIYKEFLKEGEFERESELLLKKIPPHENIIKVFDFIKNEYVEDSVEMMDLWLMTEICHQGNLKQFACRNNLTIKDKIDLMFQAARGVEHLHSCQPEQVVHRDIKPENILITGNVRRPIVRLCDFGCARTVKRVNDRSVLMKSMAGTESYWAPEQHEIRRDNLSYDKSIDTFSLGVSNLALLESSKGSIMKAHLVEGQPVGRALYEMHTGRVRHITINIDKSSDTDLVSRVKDIIKKMIVYQPAARISMNEVVARLSEIRDSLPPDEILLAVKESSVWVRVGSVWEKQADLLPEELSPFHVCFCTLPDGICALGGWWAGNVSSECYHFSVHTRTWKRLPDMPTAWGYVSAVVLEHVLMVLGGVDKHFHNLAVCEKFHMADGVWGAAASMIEPLRKPLVAAAGNKIYIVPRQNHISPSSRIQQYDPTADRFSTAAQLPQHVQNTFCACLVAADEKLYLLGGMQRLALQYSPAADQWTQLLSQPSAGYDWGCCGAVHNDKLLLCGGETEGTDDRNLVEEFDISTQQWKIIDVKLPFNFSLVSSHVASIHV